MSSSVYFVSGGNRGIGLALVKKLSTEENSTVIATARDPENATDLQDWINKHSNVHVLKYDAAVHSDATSLANQIEKLAGGIDVFVANAAIGEDSLTVLETPVDSWSRLYNINVVGPIVLFKALYPLLLKRETRKVIFVSSGLASQGAMIPGISSSSYGQTKSALNFTAKELSLELEQENFIVIPIYPGLVDTEMGAGFLSSLPESVAEVTAQLKARMITPEESGKAVFDIISSLTKEDNGKFLKYDRTIIAW